MTKSDIIRQIGEIIGSYSSGCVICRGATNECKIDIYDLHWNCYKLIKLLINLEKS